MGLRGPAPKPRDQKILQGTFRKDRDRGQAIAPTALTKVPKAPSWLSTIGKVEWRRVARELVSLNAISALDTTVLANYCAAFAKAVAIESLLQEKIENNVALTQTVPQGTIPLAEFAMATRAWSEATARAAKLGITPSDRTRVKPLEPKVAPVDDPWAAIALD